MSTLERTLDVEIRAESRLFNVVLPFWKESISECYLHISKGLKIYLMILVRLKIFKTERRVI